MPSKRLINKPSRSANRPGRKRAAPPAKPRAQARLAKPPKTRAKAISRSISRRPNYNALSHEAGEFIEKAEGILQIIKDKDLDKYKLNKTNPYNRPSGIFKREAYRLIRMTIRTPGGHKIIKNIHLNLDIEHKGPAYNDNAFYWGLLAMDHERDQPVLTPQEVGLLARQMLYADRHGVPPCLLVGFLHQAGITGGISQEKAQAGNEGWKSEDRVLEYAPDASPTAASSSNQPVA